MKLAEMKSIAKARGLPSSGNKSALFQMITNASSVSSKAKAAPQPTKPRNAEVRVRVQLDSVTLKAMGLKLTSASTDANGQPEYVYTKIAAAKSSGSAVRVISGGISKGAIDKKDKKQKSGKKASEENAVSDEALDEAVNTFLVRLDEKKVPVALCREVLKFFMDEDQIPKQKNKVYEVLAEQTHYETDSDSDDDDDDDEDDEGSE